MIWSYLLHLGTNMWGDIPVPPGAPYNAVGYRDKLNFDRDTWVEITQRLADAGFNQIVIDLADAVRWQSHPEIAVSDAWTVDELSSELVRLRELGLEPIPKLNFSAGHDDWLGEYKRVLSTPQYYKVVEELITEAAVVFDQPRFFHLGMDEETMHHQSYKQIAIVRGKELWWHDLNLMLGWVRGAGSRPWVWSDPAWYDPEYFSLMPKDVVQSNWYYGTYFAGADERHPVRRSGSHVYATYLDLDDAGFDQVPTASTWSNAWNNFELTLEFAARRLNPDRLIGMLQAPWVRTIKPARAIHLRTIEVTAQAIEAFNNNTLHDLVRFEVLEPDAQYRRIDQFSVATLR